MESFILLESLKFIVFFMVCQTYCKAALEFLPSKEKWLIFLNILVLVGLSILSIGTVYLLVNRLIDTHNPTQLCRQPIFLILRAGGEIVVYFFLAIGVLVTRKIYSQVRETHYERGKQMRQQRRAIRKMWIVICSCVFNCTFQIIYDSIIFSRGKENPSCELIIYNSVAAGEVVWMLSRSNACVLWMLPILYIFLPHRFQLLRCCCRKRSNEYGVVNTSDDRTYSIGSSIIDADS